MFWKKVILIVFLCLIIISFFFFRHWAYILIITPFFILGWVLVLARFYLLQEGFCLARSRGGEFREFIIRWSGKKFDEDWNVVSDASTGRHFWGGLIAMWFFEKAHEYFLSWMTLKEGQEKPTEHNREKLNRVLLKDKTYYVEIRDAEDAELMPLRLVALITTRVINPYKAIFGVDDWLQVVLSKIAPAVRDAVSKQDYQTLIKSKKDIGKNILDEAIDLVGELLSVYGVQVVAIEVRDIDPENEEDRKATEAPIRAKLDAKKVAAEAEGQKEKTIIDAEALAAKTLTLLTADVEKVIKTAEADAKKIELMAEATKKANVLKFGDVHKGVVESIKTEGITIQEANDMTKTYIVTDMEVEKGAKKHYVFSGDGIDGKEKSILEIAAVVAEQFKELLFHQKQTGNVDNDKEEEKKSQRTKNIGGIEIPDVGNRAGTTGISKEEAEKKKGDFYKNRRS